MKSLVKTRIPFNEVVALADTLLSKPPEWFEPFLGHVPASFDEISAFVNAQVKERLEDEVWANVRRHLISFRKLLYSGRKEVEPLSLRAVRVSTRKDHFYVKESRCRSR
jgi:hypothetical protein